MFTHAFYDKLSPQSQSPPQLLKKSMKPPFDFHESRLSSLRQVLQSIFTRLLEDPMLKILSSDKLSSEFVNSRVNEIFTEVIDNEREGYYSSLFEKYARENLSLREEFMHALEKSEMKTKEMIEKIEKNENLLEFEKKQNEKLSKTYAELMKKFSDNSKDFDMILQNKESEYEKNLLALKLETSDLKGKILDYEGICEKMDKEIEIKSQEIKRMSFLLDKTSLKSKEIENNLMSLKEKLKEKDQEIDNYRLELDKCMEMQKERNDEFQRAFKEKEGLLIESLRKNEDNMDMKINELEEKFARSEKEEIRKIQEKIKRKKKNFKEDLRKKEEIIQDLNEELDRLKVRIEDYERNKEKTFEEQRGLLEKMKARTQELLEENKEITRKAQIVEKEKVLALEMDWEEKMRRKIDALKQEYEKKLESLKIQIQIIEPNKKKTSQLSEEDNNKGYKYMRKSHLMSGEKEASYKKSILIENTMASMQIQQSLENFAQKNNAYEDQIKTLNEINFSLKKETENLKSELKQTKDKSLAILEEKDSLELKALKLSKSLEDLTKSSEKQLLIYQKRLEYLEEEKTKGLEKNLEISHQLEEKNNDFLHFQEEIKEKTEKLKTFSQQIERLSNEKLNLEKDLTRLKLEYQEKVQKNERKSLEFEENSKRKTSEIQTLEGELNEIKRYLQEKSEEALKFSLGKERNISDLEKALESHRKEIEDRGFQIKNLEKSKEEIEKSLLISEKEKENLKNKVLNNKRSWGLLKRKLKNLIGNIETLRKENERLKESLKKSFLIRFQETYKGFLEIQEKIKESLEKIYEKTHNKLKKALENEKRVYEENLRHLKEKYQENESIFKENLNNLNRELKDSQENLLKSQEEKSLISNKFEEFSRISAESLKNLDIRYEASEKDLIKSHENIEKLKENLQKASEKEIKAYEEFQKLKKAFSELHEKHQKVYEEVSQNIEKLKENQHEEIRQLSLNYEEIIETLQGQNKKSDEFQEGLKAHIQENEARNEILEKQIMEINGERDFLQGEYEGLAIENEKLKRSLNRKDEELGEFNKKMKDFEGLIKEKEYKIQTIYKEKGVKEENLKEMRLMFENLKEERTLGEIKEMKESEDLSSGIRKDEFFSIRSIRRRKTPEKIEIGEKESRKNHELLRSLNELKSLGNKMENSFEKKGHKSGKNHRSGPVNL